MIKMSVTRLNSECLKCLLDKHINNIPNDADEEIKILYIQQLLNTLSGATMEMSAPEIVVQINQLRKEMFGYEEDFADVKTYFNDLMLAKEPQIEQKIATSEDMLEQAIVYAMLGNYIDFGAMAKVDEEALNQMLDNTQDVNFEKKEIANLRKDLAMATNVVFLTDNCGEIVFDKLLIKTILLLYPNLTIDVIVRGKPVLNDATMEDAKQVGLDLLTNVLANGTAIAGTCLDKISAAAQEKIEQADVVIAKGQGNFETMRYCGKNVYYMFLCKCKLFAERFGVSLYSGMVINDLRMK